MQTTWSFTWIKASVTKLLCAGAASALLALPAVASAPDWLKQAASLPAKAYGDDVAAVVLLNERIVTVTSNGEIRATYRKAYRILRPQGRRVAVVIVPFDSQRQLTFLKGWSLTAQNQEEEMKEKDAVESTLSIYALYSDTHHKILQIRGADPGNVIGYEYQQKERSSVMEVVWPFQDEYPVQRARLSLELSSNWRYSAYWFNHPDLPPQINSENHYAWELADVPAIESEEAMPNWRSLAGHLGIALIPPAASATPNGAGDWRHIGQWYWNLASGRREVNPQINDKARELTANISNPLEKIERLASYVQHQVRYVAVEIGIGGYQPHSASEVSSSGYGDCKDKATLLSALLHAIGIESYYVLINSDRGFLSPGFPTMLSFDHVILAIRLPQGVQTSSLFAAVQNDHLGSLLFFDPTDNSTTVGYIPPHLQASHGLLVTETGGDLVRLPLIPPNGNRILRLATLKLDGTGTLEGRVQEIRRGPGASEIRERLIAVPAKQRQKVLEHLLSELVDDAILLSAGTSDLSQTDSTISLDYTFRASGYGQRVGDLLLFHPCAMGSKRRTLMEGKPRKYPVVMAYTTSESDVVDITYPDEYHPDELPGTVKLEYPFGTYKTEVRVQEHQVHYSRTLEFRDVDVPLERLDDLKKFYREIYNDERTYAILKSAETAK